MTPEEAKGRIEELEEALRRERAQSERFNSALQDVLKWLTPHVSRDLAEASTLRANCVGAPIREIIDELEREFERGSN